MNNFLKKVRNIFSHYFNPNPGENKQSISQTNEADPELVNFYQPLPNWLENAYLVTIVLDKNGLIIYCNNFTAQLTSYSKEELIGKNFRLIICVEEGSSVMRNGQAEGHFESSLTTRKGKMRNILWNNNIIRNKRGSIIGTLWCGMDNTERKRAEEHLKMLSQAIDQNPVSIIITDPEGVIEYVNPKFTETTGYTPGEVLGLTPRILKSGINPEEEYTILWKTIKEGKQWHGTFQNKKKNGDLYFETTTVLPIFNDIGNITQFLGLKEDITHRLLTGKQIKTLSTAIEQSPTSIIITDSNGRIEFVNTKFTSFMQYTFEEVKGKLPRIFNEGHLEPNLFESMWYNLKAGKIWKGQFENRKKDKTPFWEHVTISPMLSADGTITNFILINQDITENKLMFEALLKAKEKAEESDRLKSAFLQNLSHEIRTPMNAIMGFSELLESNIENPRKITKYASIIREHSAYLLDIINDILDISIIETGQQTVNLQNCNLNGLLKEVEGVILNYRSRIKKQNIAFILDIPKTNEKVLTDHLKLKQILINLLCNAFKFTHEGKVELGYRHCGDYLKFYVLDSGIGISHENKNIIFERFQQVHTDHTTIYGGTGLGLPIVKGLLRMLGGEIWLESEPLKGSIFFFTVPCNNNGKAQRSIL